MSAPEISPPPAVTGFLRLSGEVYTVGAGMACEEARPITGQLILYQGGQIVDSQPFSSDGAVTECEAAFEERDYPADGGAYKLKIQIDRPKDAANPDEPRTHTTIYPFTLDNLDELLSAFSFGIKSGAEPEVGLHSDKYAIAPDKPPSLSYSLSTKNGFLNTDLDIACTATVAYQGAEQGKCGRLTHTWSCKRQS